MVKKGFSLAEALIVMAVISIFFAAASKIITTKPKPPKQLNPHGYYECFLNDGSTTQRYVRNNLPSAPQQTECIFEPPNGIAFFNINSYGPVYHSSFEPNIKNKLHISVSTAGITISSDTGVLSLDSNSTQDNIRMFLGTLYPDSLIYNNGTIRTGVIISW